MTAYAMGIGRPPFSATNRKLVVRRSGTMTRSLAVGDEMPQGDMTDRQVAVLWDQGWIDTVLVPPAPPASAAPARPTAKR